MSAIPVVPGSLYQVKFNGRRIQVRAAHGCDAICAALRLLGLK